MDRDDTDNYEDDRPGWLLDAAEAAYSLRNRSAGLDAVALAEGSVLGFDTAQAQAILDDSRLLADLLAHWKEQGSPSRAIERIAGDTDIRGQLHRQLLAAAARSATVIAAVPTAQLTTLSDRRRSTLSYWRPQIPLAAGTDPDEPGRSRELPYPDVGATVKLFLTEDANTVVEVTSTGGTTDSEVAWLHFFDNHRDADRDLLVLLLGGSSDQQTGEIVLPGNHLNADYPDFRIIPAVQIPAELAAEVSTAVRLSSSSSVRNAWRSVARSLPSDHHVRLAVVAGLQ